MAAKAPCWLGRPRCTEWTSRSHYVGDFGRVERFDCRAGAQDPRAITLVLDLAQAFEHASFPVVWAWATHFKFSMKIMHVLCGYCQH